MNRKGNMAMIGILIVVFVGVIVALALFNGGITSNVAGTTNLNNYNTSTGNDAISEDGGVSIQNLEGKAVSNFLAVNATTGDVIAAGNYTIANNQIVNGELTATINATGDAFKADGTWNVSYNYQPTGYITSSGGRALANIIIIFAALAIIVFVIAATTGTKVMDMLGALKR